MLLNNLKREVAWPGRIFFLKGDLGVDDHESS